MLGSVYALSTIFIQIYEGGKGKNGSTVAVSCLFGCYYVYLVCAVTFSFSYLIFNLLYTFFFFIYCQSDIYMC